LLHITLLHIMNARALEDKDSPRGRRVPSAQPGVFGRRRRQSHAAHIVEVNAGGANRSGTLAA
jgi:hypothetical protein